MTRVDAFTRWKVAEHAGDFLRGRTRYQPFVDHLAACHESEVILTFPMIEAMVGAPLGTSMTVANHLWASPQFLSVRRWRALGWRNQCVIFTRDVEQGSEDQ